MDSIEKSSLSCSDIQSKRSVPFSALEVEEKGVDGNRNPVEGKALWSDSERKHHLSG